MNSQPAAVTHPARTAGLPVEITPDGMFRLLDDVRFCIAIDRGLSLTVTVPCGHASDGASIPRPLWWIVGHPLDGGPLKSAIVHDWLCEHARTYRDRKLGDTIFLYMLDEAGISWWRRTAIYMGVRFYARVFWRVGK